jgi:glycosyltransferase involved in cell wall biosynthesis
MRILTLSNCHLAESQGSGYVIMNFARGLEARGHRITLLGPDNCMFWPTQNKARSLRLAIGLWRTASRLVREFEPDLVEFYGGEAWLATTRLAHRPGRRFKIVAHSNGIEPFVRETLSRHGIHNTATGRPPKWYQGRMRFPMERAFSHADAVVTVSRPEADYVVRKGFQPPDRVLGIDNALTPEFLDQLFVAERPKTIGYCGSWRARKGTNLLVEDMVAVLREAPDWSLHLVGVGREFKAADHFPAALLPRIAVTGFVADKLVLRSLYQSWSIALMPSIYESFGLVAAEAMACGCALVANRTGFAASLLHETDALLLEEPASPLLHDAVLRLIHDEPLRRRIAESGWHRVQSLRWKHNVDKVEEFYNGLVADQPQSPASLLDRLGQ